MDRLPLPLLVLLVTFCFSTSVYADVPLPHPDGFEIPRPTDRDAFWQTISKDASAERCEVRSEACRCVRFQSGPFKHQTFDLLSPTDASGGLMPFAGGQVWRESIGYPSRVAYENGGQGFVGTLKKQNEITDVTFGQVTMPNACGQIPTVEATSTATSMAWSGNQWLIRGFQEKGISAVAGEAPGTGWMPLTLRSDGDVVEGTTGLFLSPLRSGPVISGANTFVGLGWGLPTRTRDLYPTESNRFVTLEARYDLDQEKILPFADGDFFLGNQRGHVAGYLEHPQPGSFSSARKLSRDRLFRSFSLSGLGASLSGPAHSLHTNLGVLSDGDDDDVLMMAQYTTHAKIGVLDMDLYARHTGDQRDTADDRLLQSTTVAAKFAHQFGDALMFEPAAILATNFGVVPIDAGYDASATGLLLAQAYTRLNIVGQFSDLLHRIRISALVGRDVAGFQQRFLRDGSSPFPFRRRSGFTYGRAAIEQTFETSGWSFELPIDLSMRWTANRDPLWSPSAGVAVTRDDARLAVDAICETGCDNVRFMGIAGFGSAYGLHVRYALSNLTGAQLIQRLERRLHVGPSVPVLLTQNSPLTVEPDWSHAAEFAWRRAGYRASVLGRYDVSGERGGAMLSVGRYYEQLGWGLSARGGYEFTEDVFNVGAGMQGRF